MNIVTLGALLAESKAELVGPMLLHGENSPEPRATTQGPVTGYAYRIETNQGFVREKYVIGVVFADLNGNVVKWHADHPVAAPVAALVRAVGDPS